MRKFFAVLLSFSMLISTLITSAPAYASKSEQDYDLKELTPIELTDEQRSTKSVKSDTKAEPAYYLFDDFEGSPSANGWSYYDADGDGYNWGWATMGNGFDCGEGAGCAASASFDVVNLVGLSPDNWFISPAFTLPEDITAFYWYDDAQDPEFPNEKYSIYIAGANATSPSQFRTSIYSGMPSANWAERSAVLTPMITDQYAGQDVRIAFRHYNCSDQFFLKIDYIYVECITPTHCVSFYDWDGSLIYEEYVEHGMSATAPEPPVHDGMVFVGWSDSYQEVTEDRSIYALYDTGYTVTFVDWDGTVLKIVTVAAGGIVIPPDDPYREGYVFSGWDGSYTAVDSDRTLTAQYEKLHTVTFLDWDDTVLKTTQVRNGRTANPPRDPRREGYYFAGWDGSYENVTEDRTLKALYSTTPVTTTPGSGTPTPGPGVPTPTPYNGPEEGSGSDGSKHIVTFLDWDYTYISDYQVVDRYHAVPPANPTRSGYIFTGWNGDYHYVTENRTLIAQYINVNDIPTPTPANPTPTPTPTSLIPTPTPYTGPAEGTGSDGTTHVVTFLDWDFSFIADYRVTDRYHAVPPADPTRNGYVFIGWSGSYYYVTENRTLVAQYMDINDVPTPPPATPTQTPVVPTPTPTPTSLIPTPTPYTGPAEGTGSDGTTHVVTFLDWDFSFIADDRVTDRYHAVPPADPTRGGYVFIGWSGSYYYVTENRTLVAQYMDIDDVPTPPPTTPTTSPDTTPGGALTVPPAEEVFEEEYNGFAEGTASTGATHIITFLDWNGTFLGDVRVTDRYHAVPVASPMREGYIFVGWDRSYKYVTENRTLTAQYRIEGDVTNDGRFNTGDAVMALRACAGIITLSKVELYFADFNRNGTVNTGDVVFMLRTLVQ